MFISTKIFNAQKGGVRDKIIKVGNFTLRILCVKPKSLHFVLQTEFSEVKMENEVTRCIFQKNNLGIESYEFSGAKLKAKRQVRYLWQCSVKWGGMLSSGHTPGA